MVADGPWAGDLNLAVMDEDKFCEDDDAAHGSMHVHDALGNDIEDEQPHIDMSKWMLLCNTESEDETLEVPEALYGKSCKRIRALESQPAYQRLKELGLTARPNGCSLGIHPSARVWRSSSTGSSHYSRSFDGETGRTSWQALLRVVELMLESFLQVNSTDKLVKHQLARIKKLRSEEPQHKD